MRWRGGERGEEGEEGGKQNRFSHFKFYIASSDAIAGASLGADCKNKQSMDLDVIDVTGATDAVLINISATKEKKTTTHRESWLHSNQQLTLIFFMSFSFSVCFVCFVCFLLSFFLSRLFPCPAPTPFSLSLSFVWESTRLIHHFVQFSTGTECLKCSGGDLRPLPRLKLNNNESPFCDGTFRWIGMQFKCSNKIII